MLLPLIYGALTLGLIWIVAWYRSGSRNLPPGPLGLPFLGYYPFLSSEPYKDFLKLACKFGNVFSFRRVGGTPIVVLNDIDVVKEVLVNRSDEFVGRPRETNLIEWISDGMGITQEEGDAWKEHRRFFLQAAKNFGFGKGESEGLIHEEVKLLVQSVNEYAGRTCDLKLPIAYVANSVICQILFSKRFEKNGEVFKEIAEKSTRIVEFFTDQRLMLVGLPYNIHLSLFPSSAPMRKAKNLFKKVSKVVIEEHIRTFDPSNLRDYVDDYLNQASKLEMSGKHSHTFTRKRLVAVTSNMIMEGTESVGGTIRLLLDVASRHPEEQKLVQEELDSAIGRERLPSWSDRPKLPYTDAFIQETYRHNLPFRLSTMYSNFRETTIQGYRIPKRTIIVANLWAISNDPRLFPDPSKFDPKRFLDDTGKRKKLEGLYAFGMGKRSCIGESLAQMEVFMIIAAILQNFTLHSTGESAKFRVEHR